MLEITREVPRHHAIAPDRAIERTGDDQGDRRTFQGLHGHPSGNASGAALAALFMNANSDQRLERTARRANGRR
jgi:hypothetical protein